MRTLSILTFLILICNLAAFSQQSPVKVTSVKMENTNARKTITGSLINESASNIASQEAGLITFAGFRRGDQIKKDAILYKLDDTNLKIELQLAHTQLAAAANTYEQKNIEFSYAEKELARRNKALATSPGAISEQDLESIKKELTLAKNQMDMAKIQKETCQLNINLLTKRIQDMTIKAPFDGLVRIKSKEVGEWLNKGETALLLVTLDTYEARFEIPQSISLQSLVDTKEVEVHIQGAKKTYIANQFNFIAGVNENSRNYTVAGLIKGPSLDLISGRTISAFIPIGKKTDLLKITTNAIIKDPAGFFVYKIVSMPDNKTVVMQTPVQVEFTEGIYHYCTSSMLKADDQIVTEGNERLRPMAPVQIIGEQE